MSPAESAPRTGWLGAARRHFAVCESTNDEATKWARAVGVETAPHGALVSADQQTRGRGRLGRTWVSPAGGNLYVSVILRPTVAVADVPAVTLAAGVAVVDAVNSFGARASLKWPNDVLCGEHKLAGILTEMSSCGGRIEWVVVGIGVNIHADPAELPLGATSLAAHCGDGATRLAVEAVLGATVGSLEHWLAAFFDGGLAAIRAAWLDRLNRDVELETVVGGAVVSGQAAGLTETGALRLRAMDGREFEISAGDVAVVRNVSR